MRDYAKVAPTFWTSPTTARLSDGGKLLGLYLLTCPHCTALGCFRLPNGYVESDLGWDSETLTRRFEELFRNGFAERCERTCWVLLPAYLKFNRPENPNQQKSLVKLVAQVPKDARILPGLIEAISQHAPDVLSSLPTDILRAAEVEYGTVSKPFGNGSPTISETLSKPETETEAGTGTEGISSEGDASDEIPTDSQLVAKLKKIVWPYYLEATQRNPKTYRFTLIRQRKGVIRLSECLRATGGDMEKALALMKLAVDGLAASDWHMGRHFKSDGKKYCEWEQHLFKNYEQMERWWNAVDADATSDQDITRSGTNGTGCFTFKPGAGHAD